MRINELIAESLSSPVPWVSSHSENIRRYQFEIDGAIYQVRLVLTGNNDWSLDFSVSLPGQPKSAQRFDLSKLGHQQTVFSTLIKILGQFIDNTSPRTVEFGALSSEKSRVRLYRSLLNRWAPILQSKGYITAESQAEPGFVNFYLIQKK